MQLGVISAVAAMAVVGTACSSTGGADTAELGDNPVMGSEGPGAIAEADQTNYALLVLIAVLLITAGVLLVTVSSWQRRRADGPEACE